MDIKSELVSNQTILMLMSSVDYNSVMVDTLENLSGNICYVTANKTFDSLKETFEKNKINIKNVVFIDAISKTIKKTPGELDSVYFVSSPGALTELSVVVDKFLRHKFDYLIFDSVTNLGIYNKIPVCIKFMSSLINKIKKTKTKAIFYAINKKEDELPQHLSSFVDKVVEVDNISANKK